ncbi:DUF599 domain-containing protein [Acidovorax sp. NCPPB 2350]|nr:DUF599 domain-containing protein [Acidovorax sp. NCPPB 2350]
MLPHDVLASGVPAWMGAVATLAVPLAYEVWSAAVSRRHPGARARGAHARLRTDWLDAVSAQPGSEILAVQTLRNALMSATMAASTAMLGLMGAVGIAAPSLRALLQGGADARGAAGAPGVLLEVALLTLLCASLTALVMAVRHYHHAGFVAGMPVGSPARLRWTPAGQDHLRKAGGFYSRGLRWLVFVVPVIGGLLHPAMGPLVAVALVAGLVRWDAADTTA